MRILGIEEVSVWCKDRNIEVDDRGFLSFRNNFSFNVPSLRHPYQIAYLAHEFLLMDGDQDFKGGMVWVREVGVWAEHVEKLGMWTVNLVRNAAGCERVMEEAPGQAFERNEQMEAHCVLAQAMLVPWDCFFVPPSGECFAFVSHDSFYQIASRTEAKHQHLLKAFSNWSPEDPKGL